ncbi:hypothetical protein RI129_002850 [Pyrocoelia pectoralis]|uniref:DDE Tnp4 domain-containing protein n=1 Tax=Pyrocoelia pectoralis TaxID=417401 RepID=A0AAN7VNS0_9COLE
MSNISDHLQEINERGTWLLGIQIKSWSWVITIFIINFLGDSGYPLKPWLLTPIERAAEGTPEARYTSAHIHVRNCIERCNGVLKSRFRCLLKHRVLHYSPLQAAKIIYSCCVLHNILIQNNVEVDEDLENEDNAIIHNNNVNILAAKRRIRAQLIRNNFM